MSKRLQVRMPEQELEQIRHLAQREGISVSAWVRRALAKARAGKPRADAASKLAAIRRAADYSFPTGDIAQLLEETARGYEA